MPLDIFVFEYYHGFRSFKASFFTQPSPRGKEFMMKVEILHPSIISCSCSFVLSCQVCAKSNLKYPHILILFLPAERCESCLNQHIINCPIIKQVKNLIKPKLNSRKFFCFNVKGDFANFCAFFSFSGTRTQNLLMFKRCGSTFILKFRSLATKIGNQPSTIDYYYQRKSLRHFQIRLHFSLNLESVP